MHQPRGSHDKLSEPIFSQIKEMKATRGSDKLNHLCSAQSTTHGGQSTTIKCLRGLLATPAWVGCDHGFVVKWGSYS